MTTSRKTRGVGAATESLGLRPLTARSVLLSALMGTEPPRLPAAQLVRAGALFDLSEGAVRTALSRLTAAGEINLAQGRYELAERHRQRRERQERSRRDLRRAWTGDWAMAVVVAQRRSAATRAELRRAMGELRHVELREGIWVRPDNLAPQRSPVVDSQCERWVGQPEHPTAVLGHWNLDAWAARSRALRAHFDQHSSPAHRFTVAAATLHHLLVDPMLPDELLPSSWPAAQLRADFDAFYAAYQAELADYLRAGRHGGK